MDDNSTVRGIMKRSVNSSFQKLTQIQAQFILNLLFLNQIGAYLEFH